MTKLSRVKLLAGGAALLVGFLLAMSPLGTALDHLAYDLNFLFEAKTNPAEVVVIAIDEPSFQELNQTWPWPRSMHARLVEALFDAGATAVVLDLIFAEPSPDDAVLAATLRKRGPVVLATDTERRQAAGFERIISVQPLADFQTAQVLLGSAALPVDADGFVRRFGSPGSRGEASLAAAAAQAFGMSSRKNPSPSVQLINYIGAAGALPQYSYYQALAPAKFLPPGALADKLVFVGLITQSDVLDQTVARDSYQTPHTRWGAGYMNGVEIHAQAAQSILDKSQIKVAPAVVVLPLSLLLAIVAWWGMFRFNPLTAALPLLGTALATVVASSWLFSAHFVYLSWPILLLPVLMISIISPLAHYLVARQQRNFIHKAFSSYLAPPVVQQLMDNPELLKLGGSLREGSILFLDLQGFTSMAEKMPPAQLVEKLNRVLGDLSEIAIDEGGMVDKFIGDAIMVVWGTPLTDPKHAQNACRAALKMQQYLAVARGAYPAAQGLYARIGIHSGEFIAGNVGGQRKFDYTVIGDTVNLAARLESTNNDFGTSILISEATQGALEQGEFSTKRLASIAVKGREEPVLVYELRDA